MSDTIPSSQPILTPGLTEWQRVSNTFTAPSKTFEDIAAGRRRWWLPFALMAIFSYLLFAAITVKIGWDQVAENTMRTNAKAEERLAQAPPEQRDKIVKMTRYTMEGAFIASPVVILIDDLVIALVLWGTINFVFAGKATFPSVFTVSMYAFLPSTVTALLGAAVAWFAAPESFNLANFAPTSIGAFLSPADTNAAVYKLASALDITSIWCMILLSIGIAAVARVKRSAGYMAVFGWWALIVLIGVGYAAIAG